MQYKHLGFNNMLQDLVMTSQIALLSNRANAFPPYVWSSNEYSTIVLDKSSSFPYFRFRSAKIPLTAFVSGPISGTGDELIVGAPRAISEDWWDTVCPPERQVRVDVQETRKELDLDGADGQTVLRKWSEKLEAMKDSCIVVDGGHVFTFG